MKFQERKGNEAARASLELLYHVSRELAAALDLRTVLQRVLFLSVQNVGALSGSIIVLDDNGQPVESAIIVREKVHGDTTRQLRVTYERGLAGWVARHGQAVLIPDTSRDERWLRRPDDAQDQTGPKSAVSAPITARDRLVGVVTLVHSTPSFFNEEHLSLVQAIADQAGIAILNARLYTESQRQTRVMTALAESAAVITGSINLDEVLQRILEQASQALRVDIASLALIDPQGKELEFRASTGKRSQNVVGLRLGLGQGIAGWVAREGRGAVVADVYKDPRFFPQFDRLIGFDTRAIACAPIRSRDQVIGIIEAINPLDGSFDPDALLVLTGIGSLAGTAIRHAQLFESLEAAHQRYRELFEDSIDPILVTDWDGHILEVNRQAEETTSLSKEELQKLTISGLHSMDLDELGDKFQNLISGDTISYEAILHAAGGREIPVQVYARKVQIDSVSHLQWILHDITERKNLDRLRDDLISMIYHDLRSPLANVVSSLDVLGSTLPKESDPAFRSLLNIALRSTERIQRLTNSLLDINRMEAGQPVGNRQPVSPLSLANDALEAVSPMTTSKELKCSVLISSDLPDIFVDGDMARRVLINLIENAIKFTPAGGTIQVGAQNKGDFVQMWVKDTGPGIPLAEKERIFDKFTRLNAKEGPRGLGLGLAYCRLAVIGHGGQIWVESEPGLGSNFIFTLPVAGIS
jgi:two-component system, NtrC family, sensor histidine kinase KinB